MSGMTIEQALAVIDSLVQSRPDCITKTVEVAAVDTLRAEIARLEKDAGRLDYIERNFAAVTTQERYLPLRMIWGKGCNGRTLREACDKYMARDAAKGVSHD